MSALDRAALIEAITDEMRRHGLDPGGDDHLGPLALDAVLPLIADAIEAQTAHESAARNLPAVRVAWFEAASLVRSLLSTDSDQ